MVKYFFAWLLVLAISPLQAAIYKWTDANGVVHFSDKAHPDAEKIKLPETQSFPSPTSETPSLPAEPAPQEEQSYTVTIVQPESDATIRNNQGYLPVIVQVEPELKSEDKLQMIFDSAPLGTPQVSTVFALREIKRGTHTLAVQVVNAAGDVLTTSPPITIYMHRPRVGMVPQTRNRAVGP